MIWSFVAAFRQRRPFFLVESPQQVVSPRRKDDSLPLGQLNKFIGLWRGGADVFKKDKMFRKECTLVLLEVDVA